MVIEIIDSKTANLKHLVGKDIDRLEIHTNYIKSFVGLDSLNIKQLKIIGDLNESHIDHISMIKNLQSFLLLSSNVTSLYFIKNLSTNSLYISNCPNLQDVDDILKIANNCIMLCDTNIEHIGKLNNNLEKISLYGNNIKNFDFIPPTIKVLAIREDSTIDNCDFIRNLSNLTELKINTNDFLEHKIELDNLSVLNFLISNMLGDYMVMEKCMRLYPNISEIRFNGMFRLFPKKHDAYNEIHRKVTLEKILEMEF